MENIYRQSQTNQYHISVGVVLYNEQKEILVHKYDTNKIPEHLQFLAGGLEMGYTLLRESIEPGETLLAAIERGLQEEFSATAAVERFLGSSECLVDMVTHEYLKTTLYHAAKLQSLSDKREDTEENVSDLIWIAPGELLKLLKEQAEGTKRADLHEAFVIERFIEAYQLG